MSVGLETNADSKLSRVRAIGGGNMSSELTIADIERHIEDCILYSDDELLEAMVTEKTNIESTMKKRFARTFA